MNGYSYILAKQVEWAKNQGLTLTGSAPPRGQHAYTISLEENLFQPLLPEVRASFTAGDGGELGFPGKPGKMQAVHSSSALTVNVFQYWKSIGQVPTIAAAWDLCQPGPDGAFDLQFEEKYPINKSFGFHPNIDVVIHNNTPGAEIKRFAIECKFSEAYGMHIGTGLKEKYLATSDIWAGIPHLHDLARRISPEDKEFAHLHPAQLIKHILAMKLGFGIGGFRLLYLWYGVPGADGARHQEEVECFTEVAKADGVLFHTLTYQELIARLAQKYRPEHTEYVEYMTARYL